MVGPPFIVTFIIVVLLTDILMRNTKGTHFAKCPKYQHQPSVKGSIPRHRVKINDTSFPTFRFILFLGMFLCLGVYLKAFFKLQQDTDHLVGLARTNLPVSNRICCTFSAIDLWDDITDTLSAEERLQHLLWRPHKWELS